jgi:hypothetical protein
MKPIDGQGWKPAQTVLVLQGGGALGAYHAGVYQGLHEAGIEPDWIIGTSIGAINGALIAGNKPENRVARLIEFWSKVGYQRFAEDSWLAALAESWANLGTMFNGIPGFFQVNPAAAWGFHGSIGLDRASFYVTAPLRETLTALVDFDFVNACCTRLTVGAVNVRTGNMTYFDNRDMPLAAEHVMASGALPHDRKAAVNCGSEDDGDLAVRAQRLEVEHRLALAEQQARRPAHQQVHVAPDIDVDVLVLKVPDREIRGDARRVPLDAEHADVADEPARPRPRILGPGGVAQQLADA